MRSVLTARWMVFIFLITCMMFHIRFTPRVAAQATTQERAPARVTTLDDMFAEVARRVPAFGGMFVGADKTLQIYLSDQGQSEAAAESIYAVFGRENLPRGDVKVLQGKYGFLELKTWHDRHRVETLAIPGVVTASIRESRNRLQIGVSERDAAGQVEKVLASLGIPREAVEIVETRPIEELQDTLQSRVRPLVGGLQIDSIKGGCSLGFLAVREGQAGFVTASHCTAIKGGVENTVMHQALNLVNSVDRIGVEIADPEYVGGGSCPSGRKCRFSDTAFVRRDGGTSQDIPLAPARLGFLADTDVANLAITGDFQVAGTKFFTLEGEVLTKVGRTTGKSEGEVIDTCFDTNVTNTNTTMLCQDRVQALSLRGDSGAPVFSWSSATLPPDASPQAKLRGILWGGNALTFVFSPMFSIIAELGPLKTRLDEGGLNSPPEVKIRKPANGSSAGFGGLNGLKFEADVVDYEGCCSEVTWTSDVDGVMGHGTSIEFVFGSAGTRTVTVTAKDNDGAKATYSIIITASNTSPVVTIKKPTDSQTLYVGSTYVFEGDSSDPNEPFFKLPCSALTWSGKASDGFPKTGCTPQVTFFTPGWRTITLTGVDSEGASDTDSVLVHVVNAPPNAAPVVTILYPLDNYFLDPYSWLTLKGKVDDPDNKRRLTYKWVLWDIDNNKQTILSEGLVNDNQEFNVFWKPSNNLPFNCGGRTVRLYLKAVDADGLASFAFVDVYIGFPAC